MSDPQQMGYPQFYPVRPRVCVCGHLVYVHFISEKTKQRTNCSAMFGGRCECKQYTPEASDG
jgi:hypothetical protein